MSKVSKKTKFKCEHCNREFLKFSALSDHSNTCDIGIRKKEEHTKQAMLAHGLWSLSFKGTRRKNYSYDTFINHRDYKFFAKFSEFCINVKVISPEKYMDWCIKERMKLKSWTDELVYSRFVKYYLVHEDPIDAVLRSINYIKSTLVDDYFNGVSPGLFLMAIEMGRISPWLYLLYWDSNAIVKKMSEEQIKRLYILIDSNIWSILLKRHKIVCEEIKKTLGKEKL
jgi:hypothetical protein